MISHLYSDSHYGHSNIIKFCDRPFADVDEMDAALEQRYRETVGDLDCVLFVGDISFHDRLWTRKLIRRLPGRKMLVRGNHDGSIQQCLDLGFDIVVDAMYIMIAGHKVTVSHFPPAGSTPDKRYLERRPPKPDKDAYILHGHTHEKARLIGRRIHVGCDAWDYAPVPIDAIARMLP